MAWFEAARGRPDPAVAYSESGYLGACDTSVRSQPFFCRAGINVAGVMADGAILACPNIDRRFAQGNSCHLLDPRTGHTRLCYHRAFDLAERPAPA